MPFLLYGEEGSEIFLPAIAGQTSSSADKIFQFFKICNAIFFKMFYTVNHRELLSFVRALVSTYTLSQKRVPCLFFPNKILHYHAIFRFWIICFHFAIIYHFNICTSLNRLHHPRIVHFSQFSNPIAFPNFPISSWYFYPPHEYKCQSLYCIVDIPWYPTPPSVAYLPQSISCRICDIWHGNINPQNIMLSWYWSTCSIVNSGYF